MTVSLKNRSGLQRGFTLVELLIVIVIIAILAAISIVTYNGIQQRATNTAIKADVGQITKLLMMYHTAEGEYPLTSNGAPHCATLDDDCRDYKGDPVVDTSYNQVFLDNIKQVGTLPESTAKAHQTYYGINVISHPNFMLDGEPSPILITFFLMGASQSCTDIPGTVSVIDSGTANNFVEHSASNANVNGSGTTRCYVMFPAN